MVVSLLAVAAAGTAASVAAASGTPDWSSSAGELRGVRWRRLPTGAVQPRGWLREQASRQAGALTSHLPLFWPQIANTSWLGGNSDNDGGIHESTPYWLNGAVPLAFQLEDAQLLAVVGRYISGILDRQTAEGWLGPDTDPTDFWSRYPLVLALVQYHEASGADAALRERIVEAVLKFFDATARRLAAGTALKDWSAARAHDLIWAIHYFVDVLGSGRAAERQRLLQLAAVLHERSYDWHGAWFGNTSAFPRASVDGPNTLWTHGVNNAQAVKHGAVWYRQAAEEDAKTSAMQSLEAWRILMRFHGQASGVFSADEHLAGRDPSRGTELCVVVESMWSLQLAALSAPDDVTAVEALDALELIAFNALPGGLSGDLWSHPYLQFANTFQARPNQTEHIWANDGPDAAMYGLQPNYECCTSNFHQGYPKFISHLFFEDVANNALISTVMAPAAANVSVGGGTSVELRTEYPFGLSADWVLKNPSPVTLKVRIPAFMRESAGPSRGIATLRAWVEGHERLVELIDGFISYDIPAWPLEQPRVALRLEWAAPVVREAPTPSSSSSSAAEASRSGTWLSVGPLRLAVDLQERGVVSRRYAFEAADWDTTAQLDWRRALPPSDVFAPGPIVRRVAGDKPYAHSPGPGGCPLLVNATFASIPAASWPAELGAPGPVPKDPIPVGGVVLERRLLLPYGCTALRIAAFPEASLSKEPMLGLVI